MNNKEKSQLVKVLETLARIDERVKLGFKRIDEQLTEMKDHINTINDEMGGVEERLSTVEKLYFEAKARYDKMSMYWKVIAIVLSPLLTFAIMTAVKGLLGLPIP